MERHSLTGKVAVITGAGQGIGFEAARALAWLGCYIIIAEIDPEYGGAASTQINKEMERHCAYFYEVDISSEQSVQNLVNDVQRRFNKIDILVNNAAITPMGPLSEVKLEEWDRSYRVHLRGPVLLTKLVLPDMMERNSGVLVSVSSSGAAPYMGAYEIFKMAQRELANTLSAELEGTSVYAFTIGPGLVKTTGALKAIEKLAPYYGKTVEEFMKMSENQMISVEEAGAGFAAAIALADRFNGQEIGSVQALFAAGINLLEKDRIKTTKEISKEQRMEILSTTVTVKKKIRGTAERVE